ncbi:MAG: hypothetical protein QXQ02_05245 [Halobacteria archaeon]|nr:hypothetical protein [Candidatus Bathyarchaeota archaeon]
MARARVSVELHKDVLKPDLSSESLVKNLKSSEVWSNKMKGQDMDLVMEIVFEAIRRLENLGFIINPTPIPGPNIEAKILYVIKLGGGRFTPKDIAIRLGFKSKKPVIDRLKRLARNELVVYQWRWPPRNPRWNLGRSQRPTLTREGNLVANNIENLDGKWLNILEQGNFYTLRKTYGF